MGKKQPAKLKSASPAIEAPGETGLAEARHVRRHAAVLFSLALAIRGCHFLAMRSSLLYQILICDCGQYDAWAQRIAGGDWIGNEVFYQTPLYPYLLAVVYSVFGHSVWAVRLLQAVFGALACVAIARAGAKFFSERVGWVAGILLALYPPSIFFDGILQKASLDLLLMTTLLGVLGAAQQEPRLRWFAAAGVLWGAMTLNRENSAALLPVLLAWIVWMSWPNRMRLCVARWTVFTAGLAVVLLPVGLRNYYVGKEFLLTTAQMGPNFYIGNHRGANGGYVPLRAGRGEPEYEGLDARLIAEDDLKRPLSPGEVSRYWMGRSWDDIRSAPGAWLRQLAWKWLLTWHAIEFVDAEAIGTHARQSPVLAVLQHVLHFGVLCPLAVLGIWLTRRDWRRLWILYATLLTVAAAVTAFYVFARYRYPLVPVAALFAAAGLVGVWDRLRRRGAGDARELALGLAVTVAAAVACNWPVPQAFNDDAVTYYNAGSTMMALGRMPDAVAFLQQAVEADPKFPDAYNNLGFVLLHEGKFAEAQQLFERAIVADPKHALFHVNLANALIRQGQGEQAMLELLRAIELDPLLAAAYGPLAELEINRGDVAGAVGHMRRAVELQPESAAAHSDLATALEVRGQLADAVHELRTAVALDEGLLVAGHRLAWILATTEDDRVRNGAEALARAERLCRATDDREPQLLDALAAACAETKDYARAVEVAGRAAALARENQQADLAQAIEARRRQYLGQKPYRAPSAARPTGGR